MTQSSSQPVSPTTVARNPFIDPASDRNHFPDFNVSLAPPSHGLQGSDGDDCDGGADGGSPDVSETEEAALKMDWSIDMQAHIAVLRDKEGNGMLDLTPGRLSEQANDIADAQLNEHAAADAAKVEQFWHKALHTRQGKRGMNTPARRLAALVTPVSSRLQSPISLKGAVYQGERQKEVVRQLQTATEGTVAVAGEPNASTGNLLFEGFGVDLSSPRGLFTMAATKMLMNQNHQPSPSVDIFASPVKRYTDEATLLTKDAGPPCYIHNDDRPQRQQLSGIGEATDESWSGSLRIPGSLDHNNVTDRSSNGGQGGAGCLSYSPSSSDVNLTLHESDPPYSTAAAPGILRSAGVSDKHGEGGGHIVYSEALPHSMASQFNHWHQNQVSDLFPAHNAHVRSRNRTSSLQFPGRDEIMTKEQYEHNQWPSATSVMSRASLLWADASSEDTSGTLGSLRLSTQDDPPFGGGNCTRNITPPLVSPSAAQPLSGDLVTYSLLGERQQLGRTATVGILRSPAVAVTDATEEALTASTVSMPLMLPLKHQRLPPYEKCSSSEPPSTLPPVMTPPDSPFPAGDFSSTAPTGPSPPCHWRGHFSNFGNTLTPITSLQPSLMDPRQHRQQQPPTPGQTAQAAESAGGLTLLFEGGMSPIIGGCRASTSPTGTPKHQLRQQQQQQQQQQHIQLQHEEHQRPAQHPKMPSTSQGIQKDQEQPPLVPRGNGPTVTTPCPSPRYSAPFSEPFFSVVRASSTRRCSNESIVRRNCSGGVAGERNLLSRIELSPSTFGGGDRSVRDVDELVIPPTARSNWDSLGMEAFSAQVHKYGG